eukprot:765280-Hanusia_phi.AAC.1
MFFQNEFFRGHCAGSPRSPKNYFIRKVDASGHKIPLPTPLSGRIFTPALLRHHPLLPPIWDPSASLGLPVYRFFFVCLHPENGDADADAVGAMGWRMAVASRANTWMQMLASRANTWMQMLACLERIQGCRCWRLERMLQDADVGV